MPLCSPAYCQVTVDGRCRVRRNPSVILVSNTVRDTLHSSPVTVTSAGSLLPSAVTSAGLQYNPYSMHVHIQCQGDHKQAATRCDRQPNECNVLLDLPLALRILWKAIASECLPKTCKNLSCDHIVLRQKAPPAAGIVHCWGPDVYPTSQAGYLGDKIRQRWLRAASWRGQHPMLATTPPLSRLPSWQCQPAQCRIDNGQEHPLV